MKKIISIISMAILGLALMSSCTKIPDKNPTLYTCEELLIEDEELYEHGITDDFTISKARIEFGCLSVEYYIRGCYPENLEELVVTKPSDPDGFRFIRFLIDHNSEPCDEYHAFEVNFDVSSLQNEGQESTIIQLIGLEESLIYFHPQ